MAAFDFVLYHSEYVRTHNGHLGSPITTLIIIPFLDKAADRKTCICVRVISLYWHIVDLNGLYAFGQSGIRQCFSGTQKVVSPEGG